MTNIIAFLHTTAAYQAAVVQLMMAEGNFAAKALDLKDHVPSTTNSLIEWHVMAPPMGVAGSIVTTNFIYSFEQGRLTGISKRDWLQKASATNLLELAQQGSRLDSNAAGIFATQALAGLGVDLETLAGQPRHVFQVPARKVGERGANLRGVSNTVATPLFQVSWGPRKPPMDSFNPVRLKLLGSTPEILQLNIRDRAFSRRPPLQVTNAAALLGRLPAPRHFVEELFGGPVPYATVSSPDRVEAWLLNTGFIADETKFPEVKEGPVRVSRSLGDSIARLLLDFDTYQWTAGKLCSPDYGVKLRFARGTNAVEVRLCFECDILEITSQGWTRTENFDFGHNELRALARKLFPKDRALREVKEHDQRSGRQEFEESLRSLRAE